jgi:hypothetical protein
MKFFESGKALAAEIGCSVETLAEEHQKHFEASQKQEKDPEGGPFPAYPSGNGKLKIIVTILIPLKA